MRVPKKEKVFRGRKKKKGVERVVTTRCLRADLRTSRHARRISAHLGTQGAPRHISARKAHLGTSRSPRPAVSQGRV